MKISLTFLYGLALFLTLLASGAAQEERLELTVTVSGGEPGKGQILLSVFTSDENYLKAPVFEAVKLIDKNGASVFVINTLRPGWISVSAVYDEDISGDLNTGFLGIPTERVGFSNNAKGRFGPPSFEKTSFEFKESMKIEIRLVNAND